MRIFNSILILLLLAMSAGFGVEYQTVETAVHKAAETPHPRIILTEQAEQEVREKIKTEPLLANLYNVLQANADKILTAKPIPRKMKGRRLLGVSREVLRRITCLGMVYRITDDKRYLKRAEEELLSASRFSDWNPSHYLDVAEMTLAMALGYDWLYNDLSEETRRIVRNGIMMHGFDTYTPKTSYNNWNDVCNGSMIVAALALAETEPERCADIIHMAVNTLPIALSNYSINGAHPESITYWGYATQFSATAIAALESACGTDLQLTENFSAYMKGLDYVNNMYGPTGLFVNYSDTTWYPRQLYMPQIFWFAEKSNKPYQAAMNWEVIEQFDPSRKAGRLAALGLIWAGKPAESRTDADLAYQVDGMTPVAVHRSSWEPDASFISLKGGSPRGPHGHMDGGSFVLDMDGERWAWDLGMQNYHSLEKHGVSLWASHQDSDRWKVFRLNCFSHNTLTVNNELHTADGKTEFVANAQDRSVLNLTPLFKGQLKYAVRGVRLFGNKQALVQDELKARVSGPVRWTMLTKAEVGLNGNKALLVQNGRKMLLEVVEPEGVTLEIYPSDPPPAELDARNPGTRMVGFTIQAEKGRAERLAVVFTPGSIGEQPMPHIESLASWEPVPDNPRLGKLAHNKKLLFGCAVAPYREDQAYLDLIVQQSAIITPENHMKWGMLSKKRGTYDFTTADGIADFADENGIALHGHTLIWHQQLPAWVFNGEFTAEETEAIITEHIRAVAGHYKGRIKVWDVVNEAIELDEDNIYRSSPFMKMGPGYIDLAFREAHKADPDAILIYNDYGAEEVNAKSDAVYAMLADMLKRGVPVHGIGFQMHIDSAGINNSSLRANMQRFADLGLELYITELDVRVPENPQQYDLYEQALVYRDILQACLEQPAIKAIQTWGMTDRYSWVPGFFANSDMALPFDRQCRAKPAAFVMADLLQDEPAGMKIEAHAILQQIADKETIMALNDLGVCTQLPELLNPIHNQAGIAGFRHSRARIIGFFKKTSWYGPGSDSMDQAFRTYADIAALCKEHQSRQYPDFKTFLKEQAQLARTLAPLEKRGFGELIQAFKGGITFRKTSQNDKYLNDEWFAARGYWQVQVDGAITGDASGDAYLCYVPQHQDDFTITAELILDSGNELSLWVCGNKEKTELAGYTFSVTRSGAYLQRKGQKVKTVSDAHIRPGIKYQLSVSRKAGVLTAALDGQTLIEYRDSAPLTGTDHRMSGLYVWQGSIRVNNFTVGE